MSFNILINLLQADTEHAQIGSTQTTSLTQLDRVKPWTRLTSPVTMYFPSGENANVVIAFLKKQKKNVIVCDITAT